MRLNNNKKSQDENYPATNSSFFGAQALGNGNKYNDRLNEPAMKLNNEGLDLLKKKQTKEREDEEFSNYLTAMDKTSNTEKTNTLPEIESQISDEENQMETLINGCDNINDIDQTSNSYDMLNLKYPNSKWETESINENNNESGSIIIHNSNMNKNAGNTPGISLINKYYQYAEDTNTDIEENTGEEKEYEEDEDSNTYVEIEDINLEEESVKENNKAYDQQIETSAEGKSESLSPTENNIEKKEELEASNAINNKKQKETGTKPKQLKEIKAENCTRTTRSNQGNNKRQLE